MMLTRALSFPSWYYLCYTTTFVALVVLPACILAQTPPQKPTCLERLCQPWRNASTGKACLRKTMNLDLRFVLDLPEPEATKNVSEATYAFCPVVDEVESFTLVDSAKLAAVKGDALRTKTKTDLWVWGTGLNGTAENPPDKLTTTRVLVYDSEADVCAQEGQPGSPAFVTMLLYKVSLLAGRYSYATDNTLIGNGFIPSCDSNNVCTMDPTKKCIGHTDGQKNCAICVNTPADLANLDLTVLTTYYGTDFSGRVFLSGSSNPLNFQMFSTNKLFNDIQNGVMGIINGVKNTLPTGGSTPSSEQ